MDSLTDDLWTMVLARLPIKIFTCFKLVCKQWKSIVESPFFQNLFMSVHQNSASCSWSLMRNTNEEMAHYECDTWGLKRSLGSFIESFLADLNQKHKYRYVSIKAYSDVGLILIKTESNFMGKGVLYVANPVSRECVEIFLDPLPIGFETNECCWEWGLVTRTDNGHLLDYKVVFFDKLQQDTKLSCLIYSSETCLWSLETLHLPYSFRRCYFGYPISLNGNLHWLCWNKDRNEVVLSMNFYGTGTGSDRCSATPFPDLEKTIKFKRACTPCQGFLHYMNIVDGSKLCLWRLQSEGWQLLSEISPGLFLNRYDLMTINPLDAKTAYFLSKEKERLICINSHNGKFVIPNDQVERRSVRQTKLTVPNPAPFVLPQWLHRIPNNTVSIKPQPTTTARKRTRDLSVSEQHPNMNQLNSSRNKNNKRIKR